MIALENGRLQQLRKLTEVSRALTYATSVEEAFQLTVDRAADLLGSPQALLMVMGPDTLLQVRATCGIDAAVTADVREPLTELVVVGLAKRLGVAAERFLGVPLVVSARVTGLLIVIRTDASRPSEYEEWLLSALADQAAIALEQTRLYTDAERREELIGIVAHDLRHPLQTISMATHHLLMRKDFGVAETELVRRIGASSTLAARLVNQLVDFTRSRLGGGIPIDRRELDLELVCRDLLAEMGLLSPGRELKVTWSGQLKGSWDKDRMHQLLANLIGNAIEHGEPGSAIELKFDGSGPEVVLEVASRGPAISPEVLPVLFEAFRKLRTPTSRGLGLGLFISQQIARAHGGAISVISSDAEGTRFTVRLPRSSGI